ncbi:MAG: mechanosensitive ion channel family protein [Deltaproteobacteria bacterium]|nr:mechanosensitive ion channel family protein [Deltaproteobacteria bacterium]
MDAVNEALAFSLGPITVLDLIQVTVAITVGWFAGRIARRLFARALRALSKGTLRYAAVQASSSPTVWALRLGGLWAALKMLPLSRWEVADFPTLVDDLYQAATIALATWLGVRVIGEATGLWARRARGTADTFDDQLVPIVRKTAKVALVIVAAVMIMQNLGYPVGSLLAGLGIGGAALAFASKDTIANFFGSIVIFVDRPFQIGDWVEIGSVEGTVEEVDIRTTRIRTFANSLITVPNSQMTVTAIQNWSRMQKRRIKLDVGVSYDASAEQMRKAVEAIRTIIGNDDRFHHDFYLVNFHELGESSLNIFCYFFTVTTNWAEYMEIRQDFLLAVMEALAELDLQIAFPTRTVHVVGEVPPGSPASMLRQTPR